MSTDLGVLEELDIVLIGIDRPSYGWSDSDADRWAVKLPCSCCNHCALIMVWKHLMHWLHVIRHAHRRVSLDPCVHACAGPGHMHDAEASRLCAGFLKPG